MGGALHRHRRPVAAGDVPPGADRHAGPRRLLAPGGPEVSLLQPRSERPGLFFGSSNGLIACTSAGRTGSSLFLHSMGALLAAVTRTREVCGECDFVHDCPSWSNGKTPTVF